MKEEKDKSSWVPRRPSNLDNRKKKKDCVRGKLKKGSEKYVGEKSRILKNPENEANL